MYHSWMNFAGWRWIGEDCPLLMLNPAYPNSNNDVMDVHTGFVVV